MKSPHSAPPWPAPIEVIQLGRRPRRRRATHVTVTRLGRLSDVWGRMRKDHPILRMLSTPHIIYIYSVEIYKIIQYNKI